MDNNEVTAERANALIAAIDAGDLERVHDLIAADRTIAAARDATGVSAMLYARYRGRNDIADAMLAADPPLDLFDAVAASRAGSAAHRFACKPRDRTRGSRTGVPAASLPSDHPRDAAVGGDDALDAAGDESAQRHGTRFGCAHCTAPQQHAPATLSRFCWRTEPMPLRRRSVALRH